MGVRLLPDIKAVEGGHSAIYETPRYQKVRRLIGWAVRRKRLVAAATLAAFLIAGAGMPLVKKQFFPTSDRPEVLVEVQMPKGTAIAQTAAAARQVEAWLRRQPEARIVTTYIGEGAPRFFMSLSPELPDPSFAKIIVRTPDQDARDALKARLRKVAANGLAPHSTGAGNPACVRSSIAIPRGLQGWRSGPCHGQGGGRKGGEGHGG
ncbi:efflux RND transporter permease subunit [Novosphingobium colocasiae]